MSPKLNLPILYVLLAVLTPAFAQEEKPVTVDPLTGQVTEAPVEEVVPTGPDLTAVNELILEGEYAEADTALRALGEEFPEDAGLLLTHGEVLLALRKRDEALEKLEMSAELDPNQPRVHFQLGAALSQAGKMDRAFEEFGKELELNDETQVLTLARLNRAMLLGRKKDWLGSAAELEEALKIDPSQVQIYGDVASLYIQGNDLDSAADALTRGAEAGFESAAHQYSLGARLSAADRNEEAVVAFEEAIALDPSMVRAERAIANVLEQLGRMEDSAAHLERYLELSPDAKDRDAVAEKIKKARQG